MRPAGLDSPEDTLRMGSEFLGAQGRAVAPVTVDYYAVLSRAIEVSNADASQFRSTVYNMARSSLHREAVESGAPINGAEYKSHRAALESAIQRIESEHQSALKWLLSPRIDFAIQAIFAIFLLIAIFAIATGYLEIHATKHALR